MHELDPHRSALFTDLYELAMLGAYHAEGMTGTAVFELFFRELPPNRNYVVAAGLDDVLGYLEQLEFREDDIDWLRTLGKFDPGFLESLRSLRFTGDVNAVPEGTVVFPGEPLIQVIAPLPEAQLVETYVLNQLQIQSVAATKVSRLVNAAQGRTVTDFGSRRAHGTDAALKVARAGWIAGMDGTSNVLAARTYGIPCVGTMAHSYVQAHDDEFAALEAFAACYPGTTLLVDTYDTLTGVQRVVDLARRQGASFDVQAIRIDSGALEGLVPRARRLLDDAGLNAVKILASGGLDEYQVRNLVEAGVPVDGFGIGTELVVPGDAPHIDLSYKLVEYESIPRMKLSTGKVSLPGRKQVYRRRDENGVPTADTIARSDEKEPGEALLVEVMRGGSRTPAGEVSLEAARGHCGAQLATLPSRLRALASLSSKDAYPVNASRALARDRERLARDLSA